MSALVTAAVIGGASRLLQSGMQMTSNHRQNVVNARNARQAQQWELDMWNKMNEYNSPANQMERFQAAGLNPHLAYSQGSAGNASGSPNAHVPKTVGIFDNVNLTDTLNVLATYQDYRLKEKQIENIEMNTFRTNFLSQLASLQSRKEELKLLDEMFKYGTYDYRGQAPNMDRAEYMKRMGKIEAGLREAGLTQANFNSILKGAEAEMSSELKILT